MSKYCSKECNFCTVSSVCDFCSHYIDKYANIDGKFAGEGICDIDNSEVLACDVCGNFECYGIKHE